MPEAVRARGWELLLAVLLLGTIAYNATQSPVYLDVDNFVNIFRLSIEKGIVAVALAFVIALVAAASAGFVQGLVVATTGISSLVVTLAGLIGFRGAARILLEDRSIGDFPDWFGNLGRDDFLGPLPFALVLFLVLLVVGGVVLHRSAFGRRVYVIGNNADVARYSGIDVARVKLFLFTTSGLVAGVAGGLVAARLGWGRGNTGEGLALHIPSTRLVGRGR